MWTANRFTSSKSLTKKFFAVSWRAAKAVDWNLTCTEGVPGPSGHTLYSWNISFISLLKGVLLIRQSVHCWYLWISLNASSPGWYLWGFLIPPVADLFHLISLCNKCFWSFFPPSCLSSLMSVSKELFSPVEHHYPWQLLVYLC